MNRQLRRRFWFEAVLGVLSTALLALTFFIPDWIEGVFRVHPDQHSGSLEGAIVATLLILTIALGVLARRDWRRFRTPCPARGEVLV